MGNFPTGLRQTHWEVGCLIVYGHFYSTVGLKIQGIVRRLPSFGVQFPPLLSLTSSLPGLRI